MLGKIRLMVKEAEPDKRMPGKLRNEILALIKAYSLNGFVDYLTLSTSLLFSGQWAQTYKELSAEVFYNRVKQTDYKADGYLDGLQIERRDYKELFAEYKDNKRVLFLVDIFRQTASLTKIIGVCQNILMFSKFLSGQSLYTLPAINHK